MRQCIRKRIRRAFNATFKRWGSLMLNVPLTVVSLAVLYFSGWIEQVASESRLLIVSLIIFALAYFLMFLWFFILKPPAPKRGDANFLISCRDAEVVPAGRDGLPTADYGMRLVKVHTNIEANYDITIDSLVLSMKGKPYEAHEWEPIKATKTMYGHPRYYCFQIPDHVDLKRYKAEMIALTDKEDYGSVKFTIKQ